MIYDGVGGDYAEASLRSIAWEGRFLVVGFPAGIPRLPLNLTLLKSCQVVGRVPRARRMARDQAAEAQQRHHRISIDALRRRQDPPATSPSTFPLSRAAEAISHLASRKALGKVVVMMDDEP